MPSGPVVRCNELGTRLSSTSSSAAWREGGDIPRGKSVILGARLARAVQEEVHQLLRVQRSQNGLAVHPTSSSAPSALMDEVIEVELERSHRAGGARSCASRSR